MSTEELLKKWVPILTQSYNDSKDAIIIESQERQPLDDLARDLRAKCNGLSKDQREYYHKIALNLIYGKFQESQQPREGQSSAPDGRRESPANGDLYP